MCSESHVCLIFLFLQAFQETIEIFQQKNESFKNALKDVEEVSVSVTPELYARSSSVGIFLQRHTEYVLLFDYRTQSWGSVPLAGFATMK